MPLDPKQLPPYYTAAPMPTPPGASELAYYALLTNSGATDPTVSVIQTNIGTITWTRITTGEFQGVQTGLFITNKWFITTQPLQGGGILAAFARTNDNTIIFDNYSGSLTKIDQLNLFVKIYKFN